MSWALVVLLVLALIGYHLYVRALMKRVRVLVLGWFSLRRELKDYAEHLSRVCKLPTYFKEPTLDQLLKHSEFIDTVIDEFEHDTYLVGLFTEEEAAKFDEESSESEESLENTEESTESKEKQIY